MKYKASTAAQPAACELSREGSASADSTFRDVLVIEHLPLVRIIAARIRASLPSLVDFDDLVQAGTLGLMDAANKFSGDKQIVFSAYAKHHIRGAILDSLSPVWKPIPSAPEKDLAARTRRSHKGSSAARRYIAVPASEDLS
jgi:RNA polymerase sigma factor (sigma-70 family)